ncbi:unnamed protein product [Somion occarium]|uniref:RING-type domain-containing protein n=1 Tax=Somion occarium TaxID=3059160 RepID=A0ABP1E550_9APHY
MQLHCGICLDKHPISLFRFSAKCGHGHCETSLRTYIQTQGPSNPSGRKRSYPCPTCRIPFKEVDLHPIFIDISDNAIDNCDEASGSQAGPRYSEAVVKQAQYVTEKIQGMDCTTPVGSVQRSVKEVQKVADGIGGEGGDVIQALIDAITDLRDRITPQFALAAKQKKELIALQTSIRLRDTRISSLESEASQGERLLQKAIDTADNAKDKYNTEVRRNESLQRDLTRQRESVIEREEEIRKLKGTILAHKEKEFKQTARIAELRTRIKEHENEIEALHATNRRLEDDARQARLETETQRSYFKSETQFSQVDSDDELDIIGLPSSEPDFPFKNILTPPASQSKSGSKPKPPKSSTVNYHTPSQASSHSHSAKPLPKAPRNFEVFRVPQRPKFPSDWAAPNAQLSISGTSGPGIVNVSGSKRKRAVSDNGGREDPVKTNFNETLGLDRTGKVIAGAIALGDRRKSAFK